ncbi:MAG: LD-carboxypeptidase [Deltaproteobacteria bacterium]|nr:LD-carboxypeptidase [Deltaproteobacteria bacterium]
MHEVLKKPKALQKGDKIQIIAPASSFDREAFLRGIAKIQSWGFEVIYRPDIFEKKFYLAGDTSRRVDELVGALYDPTVQAIFCARGGYGAMQLLPALENLSPVPEPKIFVGYSDLTVLLNFFHQKWNWPVFHGPVVAKDIGDKLDQSAEESLLACLMSVKTLGRLAPEGLKPLFADRHHAPVEAEMVGGCLSLVVCSLGTSYQLETQGKILYLEDVGERLYEIDRMLTHLRLAGLFAEVKGIVFGPLEDAHHDPEVVEALLKDLLGDLNIPVLMGFPSGHITGSWTLPFGVRIRLESKSPALIFLESALAERPS